MADGVPEKVFAVSFCKKMNLYMWPPPLQKTKSQLTKRYKPQGPNQKPKTKKTKKSDPTRKTKNQNLGFGFWFFRKPKTKKQKKTYPTGQTKTKRGMFFCWGVLVFGFLRNQKTKLGFCFLFFHSIVLFLTFVVFPFLRLKFLIKKCFQKK